MPNLYPAKPTSKRDMIKLRMAEQQNIMNEAAANKEAENKANRQSSKIMEAVYRNRDNQTSRFHKFTAFTEQTKDQLLEHTIFTLANNALRKADEKLGTHVMDEQLNTTALHSMIYKFIHESGGSSAVLANMRMHGRTYYLSETHALIESTFKRIVESVDKENPDSLKIDNQITSAFKNSLESENSDVMADAISDRVVSAIAQFVEGNAKDKDAIISALNATKDKIDALDSDQEDIKESYSRLGKRFITDVRNRKHGLFNEMVNIICKDVVKNPKLHDLYMEGSSINVSKVVDKVTVMYGFLETVNTMRLIKVTPEYIRENVLGLSE